MVTESIGFYHTEEDVFARKTARQYAEFMHTVPWYDYPFADRLEAALEERRRCGGSTSSASGNGASP